MPHRHISPLRTALTVVLLTGIAAAPGPAQARTDIPPPELPGFPLRMTDIRVLNRDPDLLGMATDLAMRPDGSVCASDMGFHQVVCLDGGGKVLFKSGRKGQGPGEYEVPYRLTSLPDGSLLVLDIGTQRLSRLDPRGKYVRSWLLPLQFRQINGMRALSDRVVAIAGYAPTAGLSADSAVHLFSMGTELTHERSFGPLPTAVARETWEYWGSGRIATAPGRGLLYVRGIPNDVFRYSTEGRLVRRLQPRAPVSPRTDDAYQITRLLSSESVSNSNVLVVTATTALQVGESLLLMLRTGSKGGKIQELWWDAVDPATGRLIASARLPPGFTVVDLVGVHPASGDLIAAIRKDELVQIVRIRHSLESRRP
ncbi:MAG TPA: hypothetical protein VF862_03295 [Gemmatimonadales bacterium]